jgi:hypothetical protein
MIGRKLKIVSINLLILAVGLALLEVVFGGWTNPNRLNALNVPKDVALTYDVGGLYETDKQVTYKRDQYGLRGNYGAPEKIDVMTVGGSTTDQRYISEGATWQDILQHDFLTHGREINIANAGVDGQTTYGHIKNFDWWFPYIPNLKVKYFLFYVGLNDLYVNEKSEPGDLYGRPSSTFAYLKQQVQRRSVFYHSYRTLRGMSRSYANGLTHRKIDYQKVEWQDAPEVENHEELMETRLQYYSDRLRALEDRVRRLGANSIYVTQTTGRCKQSDGKIMGVAETDTFDGVKINGVDKCIMRQLINRRTMEFCRQAGAVCLDLAGEIKFDDGDFYDFPHTSPRGSEKIGHYLYSKLHELF